MHLIAVLVIFTFHLDNVISVINVCDISLRKWEFMIDKHESIRTSMLDFINSLSLKSGELIVVVISIQERTTWFSM